MGNGWHCNGAARLGSCVYRERCECGCVPCGKERGLIDWTVQYCSDCYRTLAECVCSKKDEPMTQPEKTTAALIARLHEEVERLKDEAAQVEKYRIDEEANRRDLATELAHVRDMLNERTATGDQFYGAMRDAQRQHNQAVRERDEQRARAEREEERARHENERAQALLKDRDEWAERAKQAEHRAAGLENAERRARSAEAKVRTLWCDQPEFKARIEQLTDSHSAIDRLLAERTRERDEARACYGSVCAQLSEQKKSYAKLLDLRDRLTRERDEAREQLAKLEWAGRGRVGEMGPMLMQCLECGGFKPDQHACQFFIKELPGHRPTCWFAKKEAGVNKIRNHRKDCPARTAEDVAWVDSQWQVNGCRAAPIEGPRPRPIGCEGCRCANAPALPETFMYIYAGGSPPKPPGNYARPTQVAEPARPEPRFKVGEKVIAEDCLIELSQGELRAPAHKPNAEPWLVSDIEWARMGIPCWWYRQGDTWINERLLRPAPKFAVGEWVTHRGLGSGMVAHVAMGVSKDEWYYNIGLDDEPGFGAFESELTAQTPQHKQCGAGYVFLGRMTNAIDTDWDLWFAKDGSPFVPGPALASDAGDEFHLTSANDKQTRPELIEARRRAVARGLVKP